MLPGLPGNKKIGWSASGKLRTYDPVNQVSLQADFPVAEDYTVQFNVELPPPSPLQPNPIEILADITWSVEGNFVRRRVSVANGVSITGVGQACRVVIFDNTKKIFGAASVEYVVGVQVAPGTRSSVQQPPTLALFPETPFPAPAFTVPPLGSVIVPIPQGVGAISVHVTGGDAVSPAVPIPNQGIHVAQIIGALTLKVYDPRDTNWEPISPGATELILSNYHVNAVTFSVTLGIDG